MHACVRILIHWQHIYRKRKIIPWGILNIIRYINAYIWVCVYRNFKAQNSLHSVGTWTCWCTLPIHCHSRGSTQSLPSQAVIALLSLPLRRKESKHKVMKTESCTLLLTQTTSWRHSNIRLLLLLLSCRHNIPSKIY